MTITGELKSKIDSVWDAFWAGGIANPLEVMEQLTYRLFIKGLYDEPYIGLAPEGPEALFTETEIDEIIRSIEALVRAAAGC